MDLCSIYGYPYNFEINCSKDVSRTNRLETHILGKMLNPVTNPCQHVTFFDNFFTGHPLLTNLAEENARACGLIRDNSKNHYPL